MLRKEYTVVLVSRRIPHTVVEDPEGFTFAQVAGHLTALAVLKSSSEFQSCSLPVDIGDHLEKLAQVTGRSDWNRSKRRCNLINSDIIRDRSLNRCGKKQIRIIM